MFEKIYREFEELFIIDFNRIKWDFVKLNPMERVSLLIVEDESSFREMLKEIFESQEIYKIDTASNGQEGLNKFIKKKNSHAEIFSTICLATHDRQEEIKKMAKKNDAIIIIGSKESANSTRLFEIAKEKNSKTYFIENSKQLEKKWFVGVEKVLVSAGASTPNWVIEEVVEKLNKYKSLKN